MVFPIALAIGWAAKTLITCAVCGTICYCGKKTYDACNKSSKRQKEKIALKAKTIDQAKEDNKKVQEEKDEWKKKYDEFEERIKNRDEEIKKVTNKLKNPDLTPEEKKKLQNQLTTLLTQQDEDKKEKESILDKLKELEKRIRDNNDVISNTTSSIDRGNSHWVWDLFTLENIVIAGGCYIAYKLLKEDKR